MNAAPTFGLRVVAGLSALCALPLFAQTNPSSPTGDDIVHLDSFNVTTSVGKYAETTSTAAMKLPIEMKDLPSSVQIINSNFINDQEAETLNDIYPYIVGMSQNSTAVNDYNMRGFSSSGGTPSTQHSIQVDGMLGLTSRHASPGTANVERVEVLKGPTSLLYGRIQPGGLIDIVTKTPLATQQTNIFATIGTYDSSGVSSFGADRSYTATVDNTGPIDPGGHLLYRIIVNREDLHSFENYNFDDNWFVYPSLTYRWDENTSITAQVEASREKHLFYAGIVAPFNNIYNIPAINTTYQEPTDKEYDNGDALSVHFQHRFSKVWVAKVNTRSTWETTGRRMLNVTTLTSVQPVQNSTVTRTLQHLVDGRRNNTLDGNVAGEFGPEYFDNTVIVGGTYGLEWYESNRFGFGNKTTPLNVYDPILGVTAYPPDGSGLAYTKTKYHDYAAYASDLIKFGPHWRVMIGGRYDGQSGNNVDGIAHVTTTQSGGKGEPEAGLLYDTQANVSFYASYAESFIPALLTIYDANNNSNFPPTTAVQYEYGVKTDMLEHTLTASLAAYEIRETNVSETTTSFNSAGNAISVLSGVQETKGFELQTAWLPIPNWQLEAGASYMPTATTTKSMTAYLVGLRLANDPRFTSSFWTRYNFPNGLFRGFGAGAGVIYQGARISGTTASALIAAPGYTRVNGALYYTWKNYSFGLNIENALDKTYIAALASSIKIVPGDPRKLIFSVKAHF